MTLDDIKRRCKDIFWWPNPFTYKGGLRRWVRDCVSMYWRDFKSWLRFVRCEYVVGHLYVPYQPHPYTWVGAENAKKCVKCGRLIFDEIQAERIRKLVGGGEE